MAEIHPDKGPERIGRLEQFLGQIVYGGNDGIVTTFAVVAGFSGAEAQGIAGIGGIAVLLFGFANLFADATAMGLGEFLSAKSRQDVFRSARRREAERIADRPDDSASAMRDVFATRGAEAADASALADILRRNPELMADLTMLYRLEMADPTGDDPRANALATFVAFILFGLIPLSPYFLLPADDTAFAISVAGTFAALTALGLLRWRVTGESLRNSVGQTVVIGGLCALVAYLVGMAFAL